MVSYNHREHLNNNKRNEVQIMKKVIITEYEKKQAAADRDLYTVTRALGKKGMNNSWLASAKRELRSRIKLDDDINKMEIKILGKSLLDNW